MSDEVRYEVRGAAAWLTIDREARRNALTAGVIELLLRHLDRSEADPAVRAVCMTGAGDRSFSSGADISALGGARAAQVLESYTRLLRRMRAFPKPLVARVNGDCLAGGLGPMLACDMAYAREGIRIAVPEVRVGLFPMMIAPLLLRSGPRKKVLELIYTGRSIPAREAETLGLLTRVVPDGELDREVRRALDAIALSAPMAIALGRRAIAEIEKMPFDEAVEHLRRRLVEVLATEDAAEGIAAFLAKREPRWRGR